MTETAPFTTTSGDYLSTLLGLWLPRYGWAVALPLVLCAIAGIMFDERFLFIALMLLFIVIPMLMSFLYTYYMLTPEARRAVTHKIVEIDEGKSLRLVYLPPEKPVYRTPLLGQDNPPEEVVFPVPAPETIAWDKIRRVKYTSRFVVYILHAPRLQFVIVPYTALKKH
ncbi:MAG: hypothetical protein K2J65_10345 [Duncaniella sp.]|nr:hypothetical protein [Duncaniella sp.]